MEVVNVYLVLDRAVAVVFRSAVDEAALDVAAR
jgi:hypothetical protein